LKAVRLHGVGQLRVEDLPVPALPPGHLRLRIKASGICGSDLHNFRTGRWISKIPVTPGHELAGEVIDVGEDVRSFVPGDLVVADSRVPCGICPACKEGKENICKRLGYIGEVCDGGFAEFVTLPEDRLLRVPAGIPATIAALSEPLGVALHLIRKLDAARGQPILIAGAGPVGGLAAIALNYLGFGPLFLIERNEARASLVSSLANAKVVRADEHEIAVVAPDGFRYIIEATGATGVLSLLGRVVASGGRLALVGLFHGDCSFDFNAVIEREVSIVGCSVFQDEQAQALELLPALLPKLERVITEPLTLEQVPAEYDRLLAGRSPRLKSIVCPVSDDSQIDAR
jgi:(R,R)-butanediol dehydrogenase / meso-butanediol dehydrogenase / diacetyl reductase